MKNTIFLFILLFFFAAVLPSYAQFDLLDKVKDKVKERVDQNTDEAIDEGLNEVEEDVKNSDDENNEDAENESESSEKKKSSENDARDGSESETAQTEEAKPVKKESLKTFSKYDFIPGEKVIFFDDFAQDNVGDFPALWNTNASGEIYTINKYPGNWFGLGAHGVFIPDISAKLPENFTLEFDLIYNAAELNPADFEIKFISSLPEDAIDGLVPGNGGVCLRLGAYNYGIFNWAAQGYADIDNHKDNNFLLTNTGNKTRVSIWFQKQRVRLWINETKIFDVPRVVPAGLTMDKIRFGTWESEEAYIYMTNVRVAVGAPDMRNKLLTEGKLVTHGILFDVNSDKIKPESYGTLKEIAKVLQENADVKVKIVGHTDSDGSDAANLDLSKRRGASVKNTLASEFGIEASRMTDDGKGETEPISDNNTPAGKANNRRVEFIKM